MKVVMQSKNSSKRKRSQTRQPGKRKVVDFVSQDDDEGDDEDVSFASSNDGNEANSSSDSEEDGDEPLQVKQVRLAREYLETVNAAVSDSDSESSQDEYDQDPISRRLQKQRQIQEGTYQRKIALSFETLLNSTAREVLGQSETSETMSPRQLQQLYMQTSDRTSSPCMIRYLRPFQTHHMTPTCVAVNATTHQAVSGSKDHSVVLWDVETEQRLQFLAARYDATNSSSSSVRGKSKTQHRTTGHIWSVAFDKETNLVAAGARDGTVRLFDVRQGGGAVHTFSHAKSGITAIRFDNLNNNTLYTASMDRCIRVYEERLLVETLYGHQAPVHDLVASNKFPISVGADRTARIWKRDTDSHLIVRCPTAAADCVAQIPSPNDDTYFLTGHTDGSLQTWQTRRKQAVHIRPDVHSGTGSGGGCGISSLASLHDLVVSGGNDGWMQFYQAGQVQPEPTAAVTEMEISPAVPMNRKAERRKKKTSSQNLLRSIGRLPIHGCINDLCMTETYVLAAVGQEPKWGRWERTAGAKNRIVLVPLVAPGSSSSSNASTSSAETASDEETS